MARGDRRRNGRSQLKDLAVPAIPDVSADVPPSPAIDRCRCRSRRRCLDGHISRKCHTAGRKAESGPGKTRYELVAHWPAPDSEPNSPVREPKVPGKSLQSSQRSKARISGLCCSIATRRSEGSESRRAARALGEGRFYTHGPRLAVAAITTLRVSLIANCCRPLRVNASSISNRNKTPTPCRCSLW